MSQIPMPSSPLWMIIVGLIRSTRTDVIVEQTGHAGSSLG